MLRLLVCFAILINSIKCDSSESNLPEVTTGQGNLRGVLEKTVNGKTFNAFYGIPYAQPPVGDLRFKPAAPAEPWKDTLIASKVGNSCPQVNIFFGENEYSGNEDCLYLNVYTPLTASEKTLLPVMVYIHGGGFFSGSGSPDLYGPKVLMDKDIILVTINYRLGALGFLSLENEILPGNNGLKDQNLALKWTKQNVRHFGGDPEKVTIFGQSAGGASVHYHVLSPLSKDFINGAIAQSGTALARWAFAPKGNARRNAIRLGEFLKCPTDADKAMIDCISKIDAKEIVAQDPKFLVFYLDPMAPFKPVVEPNIEGAFLTEEPIKIIKSGVVANVPFVLGMTSEDGAIKTAGLLNETKVLKDFNDKFDKWFPYTFFTYELPEDTKNSITARVRKFYFNDQPLTESSASKITDMYTDTWSLHPMNKVLKLHTKYANQRMYAYIFGYHSNVTFTKIYTDKPKYFGTMHGDELPYLYNFKCFEGQPINDKLIDIMTSLWANTATYGNPTEKSNFIDLPTWPPVEYKELSYYYIKDQNDIKVKRNIYKSREEFWENIDKDYSL